MKSFSVALCCTLNSLHVSSIPLWSSLTSLSTFSRLTGGAEKRGRQEGRGAGGQEGKEEEEEKEGGGGSRGVRRGGGRSRRGKGLEERNREEEEKE